MSRPPEGRPVRVALLADHELTARGLAVLLAPYAPVVELVDLHDGDASGGVDLLLHDPFSGVGPDARQVRRLAARLRARRVVLTWHADLDTAREALLDGAVGYLFKGLGAAVLVDALVQVERGEEMVVLDRAAPRASPPPTPVGAAGAAGAAFADTDADGLTAREDTTLALLCQGLTNDEIAARLHISVNTVKTYVRSLYAKIGVTSRTQAILYGVRRAAADD